MKNVYIGALLLMLLAACGAPTAQQQVPTLAPTFPPPTSNPQQPPPPPTQPNQPPTQEILQPTNAAQQQDNAFVVNITGDFTLESSTSGSFGCNNGTETLAATMNDSSELIFTLPAGITPGEYTIGRGESNITSSLTLNRTPYNADVFGIFTLSGVPAAAGETISGSYDMNYTATDGSGVNATGTFSVIAQGGC